MNNKDEMLFAILAVNNGMQPSRELRIMFRSELFLTRVENGISAAMVMCDQKLTMMIEINKMLLLRRYFTRSCVRRNARQRAVCCLTEIMFSDTCIFGTCDLRFTCNRMYSTMISQSSDVIDHKLMLFCDNIKKGPDIG